MTYDDAIGYIHSISWLGSRPGLSRISELCSLLGNPQRELSFIHIAGTNGKGSVSSMLSEILRRAGHNVGTFTSPYIYSFNERMCACGKPVSDAELAAIIEKIKPYAEKMSDSPTEFELITAAAFEFFKSKRCDIVVLECGLGGRLDSTNIIEKPLLSVITGIALDHMAYLGSTTEEIAAEKAGIIKEGCPVVVGKVDSGAASVIKKKAESLGALCVMTEKSDIGDVRLTLDGTDFSYKSKPLHLSLCGSYQPENAAVVYEAARLLGIDDKCIAEGLSNAKWPARFEVLSREPVVIFDGGHNPQGVTAAANTIKSVFSEKVNILSGVMADKDYTKMVSILSPLCRQVFTVTPDNPRALSAAAYAEAFRGEGVSAKGYDCFNEAVIDACNDSKKNKVPLVALGSLYMYRSFRDALEEIL